MLYKNSIILKYASYKSKSFSIKFHYFSKDLLLHQETKTVKITFKLLYGFLKILNNLKL